jgi:hypothetical protein
VRSHISHQKTVGGLRKERIPDQSVSQFRRMRQSLHRRKYRKLPQLESDHVAADSMSAITCGRL